MKTSELSGPALDWAVAKCEGRREPELINNFHVAWYTWGNVRYSSNWAHGGPIIEREKITIDFFPDGGHEFGGEWLAQSWDDGGNPYVEEMGETILIATMRCYVVSKLGDEVDIPESLQ
jgi:Protein of unknown function (DUF2591)